MRKKEINKLVAEKVMGWKLITRSLRDSEGHYDALCWDGGNITEEAFNPTTDLKQAWKVVEKLREESWVQIDAGKNYICSIGKYGVPGSIQVEKATVQMAICLASLKAVGEEVE